MRNRQKLLKGRLAIKRRIYTYIRAYRDDLKNVLEHDDLKPEDKLWYEGSIAALYDALEIIQRECYPERGFLFFALHSIPTAYKPRH